MNLTHVVIARSPSEEKIAGSVDVVADASTVIETDGPTVTDDDTTEGYGLVDMFNSYRGSSCGSIDLERGSS